MSELAFNVNGDGFEFPPEVTDLRARRMKVRGAPELVYGRDGRPVTVTVDTTIDDIGLARLQAAFAPRPTAAPTLPEGTRIIRLAPQPPTSTRRE